LQPPQLTACCALWVMEDQFFAAPFLMLGADLDKADLVDHARREVRCVG
jgi:hypothetical protein